MPKIRIGDTEKGEEKNTSETSVGIKFVFRVSHVQLTTTLWDTEQKSIFTDDYECLTTV